MIYNIDGCAFYGVLHPRVILDATFNENVVKVYIKCNNDIIFEKNFTKMKMHSIHLDYKLNATKATLDIVCVDANNQTLIEQRKTTILSRVVDRIAPKNEFGTRMIVNPTILLTLDGLKNRDTYNMRKEREYNRWISTYESFTKLRTLEYQPLISMVMPVYNVEGKYLSLCIDSLLAQTYTNFEICVADDCSTNQDTLDTLKRYEAMDSRIKVVYRPVNGHISNATNSALELVQGEYVGLMDNDDALSKHALYEMVNYLNEHGSVDFIYSDEDKVDMEGRRSDPHFKPDFSLPSLLGGNFICHFSLIKKSLIDTVGGFRVGYEGAQDFDLFLRIAALTGDIHHIPKILYHWRMIPGSTALTSDSKNYAGEAGKRAVEDFLVHQNKKAQVEIRVNTHYYVEYIIDSNPKKLIIVNDVNENGNAKKCLDYLLPTLATQDVNLHVVSNNQELNELTLMNDRQKVSLTKISTKDNIVHVINNLVNYYNADIICIIDSSKLLLTSNWLDMSIGYALQDDVGVVGGKHTDEMGFLRSAGLILTKDKTILSATNLIPKSDYGFYGRLLVPYEYMAMEPEFMVFSKRIFEANNGFDDSFAYSMSCIDFCLSIHTMGFHNIFLPDLHLLSQHYLNSYELSPTWDAFILKWNFVFSKDPCYNSNLSQKRVFRLDK